MKTKNKPRGATKKNLWMDYPLKNKYMKSRLNYNGIPIILTSELTFWEKLLWFLTPTKVTKVKDGDSTFIFKYKKREGKIFIENI